MTTSQVLSTEVKKYKYSENAFLPKIVTILLSQEKNCVCKSLVQTGDVVREGDLIAISEKNDGLVAKIHSPIPGKVIDIISVLGPNGCYENSIRIRFSGSLSFVGKKLEPRDYSLFSDKFILDKIAEKGVINTFITDKPISLAKQLDKRINNKEQSHSLIVRLFDDDRVRISDSLLSKFHYDEIFSGAKITAKALNAKNIIFVFDVKSELAKTVKIPSDEGNIQFIKINISKYPAGNKKHIIRCYNKNFKKTEEMSISNSDLFVDAYTMLDVNNAVLYEMPVISRYVHFSGNCLPASSFLNVKLGFNIKDMVQQLGGFVHQPSLIVINGQICGNSINAMDVPITKYVKSVEFISKIKKTDLKIYNCTDCGNCRTICKEKISPDLLYNHATNQQKISEAQLNSSKLCTECGLCNTVCPSRLPLCQTISVIKTNLLGNEYEV